jgi:predicted DNA-binding protein YlxM (UPF0122 family)
MRKKMTHKLTEEQKQEIVALIDDGFSPSDVAEKFKVSRTTVYNLVKKHKGDKNVKG